MDSKLSHCTGQFAVKFCKELENDKTTICSPLSAEIALALLSLGCKNQSHAELLKALDMTDDEDIRSSFAYLTSTLKTIERATLKMANKIYVKKDMKFKPDILKDAKEVFVSVLEQLDFEDKEASADTINEWVACYTNHKIKNIVSADMFNPKINLMLVNAIYFKELEKYETTVCSPLSAEIVLALLALGCKNQSHAELLKALDMTDDEDIRSSFAYLTSTLKTIERATLKMANKIYVKKGKTLKPEILKDAEEVFGSILEQLDFEENEASADAISEWVASHTNNKIKGIVSADMFNSQINLVMVNAIYFLGHWTKPFKKEFTKDRTFHINNLSTIQVTQMFGEKVPCGYGASPELKSTILEMHYQGNEASMVIILPDEIEGLSFMFDQLMAGHDLMADIANLRRQKVTVQIPKFKVEMTVDLKTLLIKLGVKSIFDNNYADIDMLMSNEKLAVSNAIQKAYIEVDEKGTEAAASTAVVYKVMCKRYYKRFIADRPFLYLLTARKIPLFIGIYRGIATTTE